MTRLHTQKFCPVCDSSNCKPVIHVAKMPVLCNFLCGSVAEALSVQKAAIDLVICLRCSHLYNREFNPHCIEYQQGYENSLHYSNRYQTYARQQAERLLNTYDLSGQGIIDIGCGNGDFLLLFSQIGNCTVTGFEPTGKPVRSNSVSNVNIIPDIFSHNYFDIPAKCYVSRHVLEHLANPVEFLETIRSAIKTNDTVLFLEIPDGSYILGQCSTWDIIYEHYSYFSPFSLAYILERAGFRPAATRSEFAGQYLSVDAFPAQFNEDTNTRRIDYSTIKTITTLAEKFAPQSRNKYKTVDDLLQDELQHGNKIVLWGAGSKGISFLNQVNNADMIEYVIDINPNKIGKYIPGSGQQIVSPEFLTTYQPDSVLIMNDIYRQEIQNSLLLLNVPARIISL